MIRRLALAATLALTVALLGSGCDSDSGPTTIEIPITRIEILPGCTSMPVGGSCTLRVQAFSEDQLVLDPVLVFASSSQAVATVDDGGRIRGEGVGTATITVEASFGPAQPARREVTVFGDTTK